MDGIEKITNFGINLYNQKHPEKAKEPFEINPKVRNAIKILSSVAIGTFYYSVTSYHELNQLGVDSLQDFFANVDTLKPHLQIDQYLADFGGIAAGIGAFHNLEFKDAFWSGMPYAWEAGKVVSNVLNKFEDKITGKSKNVPQETALSVEQISVDSNFTKPENQSQHKITTPTIDTTPKINSDIQLDKSNPKNEIEL